jgi:hypothetical protein
MFRRKLTRGKEAILPWNGFDRIFPNLLLLYNLPVMFMMNLPAMVGNNDWLLKNPVGLSHRFIHVTTDADMWTAEGCYLYYDTFNGQWVQSGKVASSEHDSKGIMDRHLKEHMVSTAWNDESSDLYVKYLGKQSRVATMAWRNKVYSYHWKAYFEDLELFCEIGFIGSESVEHSLTSECNNSDSDLPKGVFTWNKNCIDSLNKCKRGREMSLWDEQLHTHGGIPVGASWDMTWCSACAGMNISTMLS